MNQEEFVNLHSSFWDEFSRQLDKLTGNGRDNREEGKNSSEVDIASFPSDYKKVCNHYALAKSRHYSPALVNKLHQLVLHGHNHLYKSDRTFFLKTLSFLAFGFPRTLRQNISFFYLSLSLFLLPALLAGFFAYNDNSFIYSLMGDMHVSRMEYMYDPANHKPGRDMERTSETNLQMFGYYIQHNTSIGFRTFAGGMLAGIGTIFALLSNGMILGGVAGHLSHAPYNMVFWPFVSGHGAFELTAIVISGAAGLMLASALIMPGNRPRLTVLKEMATIALKLIMGAAVMFLLAAFVEAFWSPSALPPFVKFAVAAIFWLLVVFYFIFAGRRQHES